MILALLAGAALAATPAHYHPDDVAKASRVFASVAETTGPVFEKKQAEVGALGQALADLELGVALLGASAPAEVKQWSDATRRTILGQTIRLQRHADLLQTDYSDVFGQALKRAIDGVGGAYELRQCGATGVLAMMGRKDCPGEDLNARLAGAIDQDATLKKALADIASVEWPTVEVPRGAQPVAPLTGTTRWIAGGDVAEKLIGARLTDKREALEAELERMLPEEPSNDDVKAAQAKKDAYLAALGKDGEVLRAALTAALGRAEKKGGPAQVGWCANPVELGGCPGDDVTARVLETLAKDKKFAKDIAGLVE